MFERVLQILEMRSNDTALRDSERCVAMGQIVAIKHALEIRDRVLGLDPTEGREEVLKP